MDIYNFNYKVEITNEVFESKSTLMIGKFNIFHQGHKELFDKAKEISKINKIGITLFNIKEKETIITLENRLTNLAEIGFDFVVIIDFDFDFKSLQAKDFIDHIIQKYKVENFVVGQDFRFGLNRMWGAKDLKNYFENTFICQTKKINNIKVSSASIKEMISTGEIKLINELLLTKYNPNIQYSENKMIWPNYLIKPHSGIYFIKIAIDDYWHHGLLLISMKYDDQIILLNYESDFIDNFYTIQIIQESRIIINSRFDKIIEEDKKNCIEFFYNLQKNNI